MGGGVGGSSKVILDTGASANLVGASWLNNHNAILKASGRPQAKIAPAFASFRYGGGRVGDVHCAAMIPIAIAGHAGHFMAYVVGVAVEKLDVAVDGHIGIGRERRLSSKANGDSESSEASPGREEPASPFRRFSESRGGGSITTCLAAIQFQPDGRKPNWLKFHAAL